MSIYEGEQWMGRKMDRWVGVWGGGKERGKTNRFSRKVLALTMFLPMAEAFHAQKEPEGSTW
jgi:hypothetical protein